MRSVPLCVFFALIIQKDVTVRADDFRPTPIPLDEWHPTRRDDQAGTLHEIIKTESPSTIAAVPAHYWEDALRHSVYLTLVRDKIDQLIAQGDVISPETKIDQPVSKEIDDHDLWDKIKKAPFDRRPSEEVNSLGDVSIMAKGRLIENNEGFRFTEDDRSQDNCSNERCAEGVKAFWSVKRHRQRDQEISPGKYHYELTFSVVSQIPKKQRRPYENPIRTFTVRETSPDKAIGLPQEHRKAPHQAARPQRAIWFHKNIVPIPPHTRRPPYRLDRIFTSLFSDDDAYDQPQPKYRSNQQGYQFSKVGHGPSVDYHQQKPVPYPYKQSQPYKYVRPPLQAPPAGVLQHHYLDYDASPIITGNPYPQDSRVSPTQVVKTTRPAILPTPLPINPPQKEAFDLGSPILIDFPNGSENVTRFEINNSFKNPTKVKPNPTKSNYFSEHIRPPVYNAPPGVFVTMDKKPFKPMPPLKHVNKKPHRNNRPVDFRPSPQVHDSQSPNSDSLFDTAFRPITVNYADSSTTETVVTTHVKKGNNKHRKTSLKKPAKKHQNVKPVSTAAPDIITAQSVPEEDVESIDWANVLGAFVKTTPMVFQTEKLTPVESTTSFSVNTSLAWSEPSSTEGTTESTIISTTLRPKKRTRPPPKFTKQDKIKKHKRLTTTTELPETMRNYTTDFTPVASSTTRTVYKSFWDSKNKTQATLTTTTSTTRPSTTRTSTTTTRQTSTTPSTTFASRETSTSTRPVYSSPTRKPERNINRFRQSTLFYKGTSLKHDKWSVRNFTSQPQNYRRTSNFQGYSSSTTPLSTQKVTESSSTMPTEKSTITEKVVTSKAVESENSEESFEDNETEDTQESEYIFEPTTVPNDSSNEVIGLDITTETVLQFDIPKNKTKCKKKKNATTEMAIETSTEKPKSAEDSTDDIFEQLFGINFNSESSTTKDKLELLEEGSSHHASYLKADDELTDFMAEFNNKHKHTEAVDDEYDDDDDDNDDDDDEGEEGDDDDEKSEDKEVNEDNKESSRDSRYESYDIGRPYSFLELMAME